MLEKLQSSVYSAFCNWLHGGWYRATRDNICGRKDNGPPPAKTSMP